MKRLAVILAAVWCSSADAAIIFYRDYSSFVPVNVDSIIPGNDVLFSITADSGATYDFSYEIPAITRSSPPVYINFTEANPGGFNFAALEAAMTGDRGQCTVFGPEGYTTEVGHLLHPTGYFSSIDLDRVTLQFNQYDRTRWAITGISLYGTFAWVAPEPSSFVLLLLGLHSVAMRRCR